LTDTLTPFTPTPPPESQEQRPKRGPRKRVEHKAQVARAQRKAKAERKPRKPRAPKVNQPDAPKVEPNFGASLTGIAAALSGLIEGEHVAFVVLAGQLAERTVASRKRFLAALGKLFA